MGARVRRGWIGLPLTVCAFCLLFALFASPALGATSLSGTVTDAYTTEGVRGTFVWALQWNADWETWDLSAYAETNDSGVYTFPSLASGTYRIQFMASENYEGQYWNGADTVDTADDVTVGSVPVTGINAQLMPTKSRIRGTVRDAGNQGVLPYAQVTLYGFDAGTSSWNEIDGASTDDKGEYCIWVAPGTYRVGFSCTDYLDQFWNNRGTVGAATNIVVAGLSPSDGIDAALLSTYGSVVGTVTCSYTGLPLADAVVRLYQYSGGSWEDAGVSASTLVNGSYKIEAIEPGTYRVGFSKDGYADEYYDEKAALDEATDLAVASGVPKTGISATLKPPSIRGRVTTSIGGAEYVEATLTLLKYDSATARWVVRDYAYTDDEGDYEFWDLADGDYKLMITGHYGIAYVDLCGEYWDNKTSLAAASIVSVTRATGPVVANAVLGPMSDDVAAPLIECDAKTAYSGPAFITIIGTDVGSGVKSVSYSLDNATTVVTNGRYAVAGVPNAGTHTLRVWATDNRNNVAVAQNFTFTVDAPAVPGSWSSKRSGSFWEVDAVSANTVFALGSGGIAVTSDGGATWASRTVPAGATTMDFVDASNGWCAGANGTVWTTTNAGQSWTAQTSHTSADLDEVCFVDALHGWACGSGDSGWAIIGTNDGGATWQVQKTGPDGYLQALDFANANDGIAGGASFSDGLHGRVLTTHDGGATWNDVILPGATKLQGAYMVDANNGWTGGYESGLLYKTTDGAAWSLVDSFGKPGSYTADLGGIAFTDPSHGWVGAQGPAGINLFYTANGGATWGGTGVAGTMHDLSFVDSGNGWAATSSGVFRFSSQAEPGSLTLVAPSSCAYASARVGGYLKGAGGIAAAGRKVEIQYYSAGWKTAGSDYTDASGYYTLTVAPTKKTTYRAYFAGDATVDTLTSGSKVILPKVWMSTPSVSATQYYGRTYALYCFLKPRHTAGGHEVIIKAFRRQRLSNGTYGYVYRRSYVTTAYNFVPATGAAYTKAKVSIRLPYKGTWRLCASHSADALNAGTVTAYKYVTVR